MKILVLGASGMAGHIMSIYFKDHGHRVTTISSKHKLYPTTKLIDVHNEDLFINELQKVSYDIVINCIGVLVKESEKDKARAIFINSYLPRLLESHYKNSLTKIVHISSDAVFSGLQVEYTDNSPYDGQSLYGRSKALGEINNDKDLTIRTSIIGPELPSGGKSLFDWFCKQNGEIQGYTNIFWGGVTTIELAKFIDATISQNLTGIHNLCAINTISKFDLLMLLKDTFKKSNVAIKPTSGNGYNTRLLNSYGDLEYNLPDYPEMLKNMHDWIVDHNSLYTHYKI